MAEINEEFLRKIAAASDFRFRISKHQPHFFFDDLWGFEILGKKGAIWTYRGNVWAGLWASEADILASRLNEARKLLDIDRNEFRRDKGRHYVYFKIDPAEVSEAARFLQADGPF